MSPPFYVLEARVGGCEAEVWLNDVPIIRRGDQLGVQYGGQVNQFVRDGLNELAIVVHPGPVPAEALLGPGGARLRRPGRTPPPPPDEPLPQGVTAQAEDPSAPPEAWARLARYPRGAVVGGPDAEPLLEVRWTADPHQLGFYPRVVTRRADLGPIAGGWVWEEATRHEAITPALEEEVLSLLEEVRAGLERGDPEPFLARSQLRLAELARAYGFDVAAKEQQIRAGTALDAEKVGYGLEPLRRDQLSLRLCGEGRLIEVIGADWLPALRELPRGEEGQAAFGMFVAQLEGRWEIVR